MRCALRPVYRLAAHTYTYVVVAFTDAGPVARPSTSRRMRRYDLQSLPYQRPLLLYAYSTLQTSNTSTKLTSRQRKRPLARTLAPPSHPLPSLYYPRRRQQFVNKPQGHLCCKYHTAAAVARKQSHASLQNASCMCFANA
jgi:hypothetical protein